MKLPTSGDDDKRIATTIRLLSGASKSNRGAPLYSRLINRPLGRLFAAFAYRLALTPNQVTILSAAFSLAGILVLALAKPTLGVGFTVSILLVIGYALDSADGQLARLTGGGSMTGEWLDHIIDAVKNPALHIAIAVSLYRYSEYDRSELLLIPLLFSAVASVQFFRYIFTDKIRGTDQPRLATDDATRPSFVRSLVALPSDYGVQCLVVATIGHQFAFLMLYAGLLVGSTLYLLGALVNGYRSVRELDRASTAPGRNARA